MFPPHNTPACPIRPATGWRTFLLLLGGTASLALARAADIPEMRPKWKYAATHGFEILTDCNDSKTQAYLNCVAGALPLAQLPAEVQPPPGLPIQLILSEGHLDRELAPPDAPPEVLVLRVGNATGSLTPLIVGDTDLISVREGLATWRGPWSQMEVISLPLLLQPRVIDRVVPQIPAGLRQGLDALYRHRGDGPVQIVADQLGLPAARGSLAVLRPALSDPERLWPLHEIFAIDATTGDDGLARLREAHQMLFVRWALYGQKARPGAFWKFCARSAREPITETLFQNCFGLDYLTADEQVRAYLVHALEDPIVLRPPPLEKPPELRLRRASRAEICRLEGEWQRLTALDLKAKHPSLSAAFLQRSRRTLEHAYRAGDRDPQLLAALGLSCAELGETALAQRVLEEAATAGAVRPQAYRELARLRLEEARRQPAAENGKFSIEQTRAILQPLLIARTQPPAAAKTYVLLAQTWASSEAVPTVEQLRHVTECSRLFPREHELLESVARLALQHGLNEEAAAVIAVGLSFAPSAEVRARFTEMESRRPRS